MRFGPGVVHRGADWFRILLHVDPCDDQASSLPMLEYVVLSVDLHGVRDIGEIC